VPGSSKIEQYLEAIYRGQNASVSVLLPALANQFVFAPLLDITHENDARSTNRIKVATFAAGLRRVVPVFTSEKFFNDWSDGRYRSFSVAGGDLALTLPKGSWLVLNPGKMHSLELSPDDVITLASIDEVSVSLPVEELSAEIVQENLEDEVYEEDITDADETVIHLTAERVQTGAELSREDKATSHEDVKTLLCEIFPRFPEIREAYLAETESSQAVLGLLAPQVDPEQRFLLIDTIATISRKTYGTAGAIEVYDDLDLRTSHSWDIFNVLPPFYVASESAEAALLIEKEVIPKDSTETDPIFAGSRGHTKGKGTSWFPKMKKRQKRTP